MSVSAERHHARHRYHVAAVVVAPLIFLVLFAVTILNPVYAAALGLVAGFAVTLYPRPDLGVKMLTSGGLFFLLSSTSSSSLRLTWRSPAMAAVWNLPALYGVVLAGLPLEELVFAFTFGLYWSSVYEHFTWKRSRPVQSTKRHQASATRMDAA